MRSRDISGNVFTETRRVCTVSLVSVRPSTRTHVVTAASSTQESKWQTRWLQRSRYIYPATEVVRKEEVVIILSTEDTSTPAHQHTHHQFLTHLRSKAVLSPMHRSGPQYKPLQRDTEM